MFVSQRNRWENTLSGALRPPVAVGPADPDEDEMGASRRPSVIGPCGDSFRSESRRTPMLDATGPASCKVYFGWKGTQQVPQDDLWGRNEPEDLRGDSGSLFRPDSFNSTVVDASSAETGGFERPMRQGPRAPRSFGGLQALTPEDVAIPALPAGESFHTVAASQVERWPPSPCLHSDGNIAGPASLSELGFQGDSANSRLVAAIESGELGRQTMNIYLACDRNAKGFLEWNNGEIRDFIATVFRQQGLQPPDDYQTYLLFLKFDTNQNYVLDARECVSLVDALFRSLLYGPDSPAPARPPILSRAGLPPTLAPPAPFVSPYYGPSGALGQIAMAPPSPTLLQATGGSALTKLNTDISLRPRHPADRILSSLHPQGVSQGPQPSSFSGSLQQNYQQSYQQGYQQSYQQSFEQRQQHQSFGSQPSQPPEMIQEIRPHLVSIDLEELDLRPELQHMQAGWLQTLRYFVSMHPHSEDPHDVPLPRAAPKETEPGQFLVSAFHEPKGSVVPAQVLGHVPFKEHMELLLDKLHNYLVVYLWGEKTGRGAEEITLVGRAFLPLMEFRYQRKTSRWEMFDIAEGHKVAILQLRLDVATTPSEPLHLKVAEVERSTVTLQWSTPDSDHGSEIIGYRICLLSAEGLWEPVCELTSTPSTSFAIADLKGYTAYVASVQAVNDVGAGDLSQVPFHTARCEPGPPSKPWAEDLHDGRLEVCWRPPEGNGGYPVERYRVVMRKTLLENHACQSWTSRRPKPEPQWIEIGMVKANMKERSEPSMYSAKIGPLERVPCEYRFQIFAINKAGEGPPSELSDPQHT